LVESPGTAPGSEWFITTAIYRHSRLAPAPLNISAKGCRKKTARRAGALVPIGKSLRGKGLHGRESDELRSKSPPPSKPNSKPPTAPQPELRPTIAELFTAFAAISLSGFGGVLAWARRIMVEKRRWLTAEQFNEAFALCAFLPISAAWLQS
jgi:hypothetical protein